MTAESATAFCPCESGRKFTDCCLPYLSGAAHPATAESLMRSRYVAYVVQNEDYLLSTWHPETRPTSLHLAQEPSPKWLGLSIKRSANLDDLHAVVEFVARYKVNGRAFRMHETSRFECIGGRWYYSSGEVA